MEKSSASPAVIKRETTLVLTALTFALSFLVIGLPLWWKTTDVYRVSLPYSEIEKLPSLQLTHVIPVMIVLADRSVGEGPLWEELTYLSTSEYASRHTSDLYIHYAWKMRVALKQEEMILRHSEDFHELDGSLDSFNKMEEIGVYNILVVNSSSKFPEDTRLVGCFRRGYVTSNRDINVLGKSIMDVVQKMIHADILHKTFNAPASYNRQKPEKDKMRSLSALTAFDITFSLFIPEPHYINPQWDIEKAIKAYINPFVKSISKIATVGIKSQILYVTQFPIKTSLKGQHGENYLSEDQLPSIINPVEDKLGSYASVHPNLNFIVYVPPKEQLPLHILDRKGNLVQTNAFLSPRWGGFYIENFNVSDVEDFPYEPKLDMSAIMGVFLAQLKLLIGFPNIDTTKDHRKVKTFESSNGCDWELDYILRKNTQEQLSIAISSLHSLGQLLQTINNIVIDDEVGKKIYYSLSNIKMSLQLLGEGFLEDASVRAKNAFNSSEEAFFDPSLLALLYFPEDQKYAIYIPLFLPISIPVIMSVKQILNYWTEKVKAKVKNE